MPDDARSAQSREALDRVARESEAVGASSMARIGRHLSGSDAIGAAGGGGTDPVELWGRRVGRGLSVVLAIALTWWLGSQLGWW